MLETEGILLGTEDGYFVIWCAEGFEAFVGLLTVVETWGHAVDFEEGVGDEFWGGPYSCFDAVMGFDVAVYWGRNC